MDLIGQYDGKRPASLDIFLDLLGISEREFEEILMQQCVAPYEHDPESVERAEQLWDQERWPDMLGKDVLDKESTARAKDKSKAESKA
jgi:hypothetical protein